MNIRLRGTSLNCPNFSGQKLTLFILDCLFNRAEIDSTDGNVFESTKVTYNVTPLPARGYYPRADQAEIFYQGVTVTSSKILKIMYQDLKLGKFMDLGPLVMDGIVINITQDSIEHPNALVIALDFKNDKIVEFVTATGYRELDSITRGYVYKPFHGVPFHLNSNLAFCFLDELGKMGAGLYHRNKETHYDLAKILAQGHDESFSEKTLNLVIRNSILAIELNKVWVNLLGDDELALGLLSNWSTDVFNTMTDFRQGIPFRYHDNIEVNTRFENNLTTFIKEYGSIAATALAKARARGNTYGRSNSK